MLDRAERASSVSRSTLLIVALQLVLLAGYALLLVAGLLSSERGGETEVLVARGSSRRRIAALSAAESLLLAGPLTELPAERGALARIGLHIDASPTPFVWLVGALVALGCALTVVAPALSPAGSLRRAVRAEPLPAPLRAGADAGLLVIAAVAYWQLDRQTSAPQDGGASSGIAPLLVAAPALALLAGTVLTLRLLPPAARIAERGAARGRCCSSSSRWRWACWRSGRAPPGTVRRRIRRTSGPAPRSAY